MKVVHEKALSSATLIPIKVIRSLVHLMISLYSTLELASIQSHATSSQLGDSPIGHDLKHSYYASSFFSDVD
jgi:hypothetical protein